MKVESEVRTDIIVNAAKVYSRYGYKKTRMDDIAKSVDKGKSTLYYYFKNKDEVFKAVIEYEADILKAEILEAVAIANEPKEKIRSYLLTRMAVYQRVDNFYKALTNNLLSHLTFIEDVRRGYELQEINLLKRILEEGIEKNQLKLKDPSLAAMAIVTALK